METKACSKCNIVKPLNEFYRNASCNDGRQSWCKACKNQIDKCYKSKPENKQRRRLIERSCSEEEMGRRRLIKREWDRKYRARRVYTGDERKRMNSYKDAWKARNREKVAAHKLVYKALQKKILIRLPCEICRYPVVQAHHEDYSKPLNVIWLCKDCHARVHYDNLGNIAL